MANISIELIDLPDELIVIILKKLTNTEILYSLMGINRRLDRILYDSMFTRCLTLTRSSSNRQNYPLVDKMLDRFCLKILPLIHHKIEWLTLESLSMERILLVNNYPNLHKLGLANISWEGLMKVFNEENSIVTKFKNQISTLFFSITNYQDEFLHNNITRFLFGNIFKIFPNLIDLRFFQLSNMDLSHLSFSNDISMVSPNLVELHINVDRLTDCLYLLDGRLNQLRNFIVNIKYIFNQSENIDMKKKLDNLRYFSLRSKNRTRCYNRSIVPLLHRMNNLEKLNLYLIIYEENFIDGNKLNNDIVNHMRNLNSFIFNIQSRVSFNLSDQINIPSNEFIQLTFENFKNTKIISSIDYFPDIDVGQCHFYSYPYTLEYYENITNNFSGGLFKCVREISLFDERPFQHEFFLKISKAFPFLQKLVINNFEAQNFKSNNDNEYLSTIKYPHLIKLDLIYVHDHYIEQFLFHSKTFLSNYISLSIKHDSLQRVTNNFTRDQTKINSAKIKHLLLDRKLSKDFYQYFPNVKSFD